MIYRGYDIEKESRLRWVVSQDGQQFHVAASEEAALHWVDEQFRAEAHARKMREQRS